MAKIEARQMDVRCATSNADHATHSVAHSHTKRPFARSLARLALWPIEIDRAACMCMYASKKEYAHSFSIGKTLSL